MGANQRLNKFVNGDGISFSHLGRPATEEYQSGHDRIFGTFKCRSCKDKGYILIGDQKITCSRCTDSPDSDKQG